MIPSSNTDNPIKQDDGPKTTEKPITDFTLYDQILPEQDSINSIPATSSQEEQMAYKKSTNEQNSNLRDASTHKDTPSNTNSIFDPAAFESLKRFAQIAGAPPMGDFHAALAL